MAQIIDISHEPERALEAALAVLRSGEPAALPTETVYGLAADATNPEALARIFEVKGRPRFNPLICHMSDAAMAKDHAVFDPLAERLANAFWPGPLTLVLPLKASSTIHPLATAGLDTVGVRVPSGFASHLIGAFGKPLAAPSANTSGKISPTTASHVDADLGDRIALVLDGGACSVGVESTIVRIADGRAILLRPGGIDTAEIERVLGQPVERPAEGAAIQAPGMLASHYAPGARVRLNVSSVNPDEALIAFGPQPVEGAETARAVLNLSETGDTREAAMRLFDLLKQADATGAATIAVAPVPMTGLGEAINDRLARAAAPRG